MEESILKRFGGNVKKLRKQRGWSQEDLSNKSNLHRTYIGSIEKGGRNVSLINIEKLARALKVKLSELTK
jgi:transcriptional regulator with XRE-family HTH domain